MGQDRLLDGPQGGTGFEAEFGGEHDPSAAVRGERVGCPTGLVQGEHQLSPGALPKRVSLEKRLDVADAAPAVTTGELSLEHLLGHGRAQFIESLHLPRQQSRIGHIRVRIAAEHLARLTQQADRLS